MSNCTDFGCLWYSNNYKKDTSLKDVLGDKFLIGVAQNTRQSSGVDTASVKIVKQHFNAVVAENCMKHAIIHPEEDMGIRVAQALNYPMVSRYMDLGDEHYIVKLHVQDKLKNVNLSGILQQEPHIKLLLLKRNQQVIYETDGNFTLQAGDILILEGSLHHLKKLSGCFL